MEEENLLFFLFSKTDVTSTPVILVNGFSGVI